LALPLRDLREACTGVVIYDTYVQTMNMAGAGEWQALEDIGRWRTAGTGEWQALENGRRWRMVVTGEWEALENGSRWRMGGAGE